MTIRRFDIWLADLQPRRGTEAGKVRPVLIVQTDLLNDVHPSTIICPITTNVIPDTEPLRVQLKPGRTGLRIRSDIMIDQLRAIDNRRLIERIGRIGKAAQRSVKQDLLAILDLRP